MKLFIKECDGHKGEKEITIDPNKIIEMLPRHDGILIAFEDSGSSHYVVIERYIKETEDESNI